MFRLPMFAAVVYGLLWPTQQAIADSSVASQALQALTNFGVFTKVDHLEAKNVSAVLTVDEAMVNLHVPQLQAGGVLNPEETAASLRAKPASVSMAVCITASKWLLQVEFAKPEVEKILVRCDNESVNRSGQLRAMTMFVLSMQRATADEIDWSLFVPQNLVTSADSFHINPEFQELIEQEEGSIR